MHERLGWRTILPFRPWKLWEKRVDSRRRQRKDTLKISQEIMCDFCWAKNYKVRFHLAVNDSLVRILHVEHLGLKSQLDAASLHEGNIL